jgi:hypothetical protein
VRFWAVGGGSRRLLRSVAAQDVDRVEEVEIRTVRVLAAPGGKRA